MKNVLLILTIGLLSSVMFQSCKQSDEKLQNQVTQVLQQSFPQLSSTVKDGVATLTGTVETEDGKMTAQRMVQDIKGIKSVINRIEVPKPQPAVVINPDATIKSAIESQLSSAGFKDVVIEVRDGEVTLTGDLKRADLAKVMQIANESNPKKVINNLKLK
jgi:Predicted periplasmic or secreted lipoprotein